MKLHLIRSSDLKCFRQKILKVRILLEKKNPHQDFKNQMLFLINGFLESLFFVYIYVLNCGAFGFLLASVPAELLHLSGGAPLG